MNLVRTYTWTLSESEPKANDEVSDHGIIIARCAIQADRSACLASQGLYPESHGLESKCRIRAASFPAHVV